MTDRELLELAAKAAGIEFNDKRSSTGGIALYCALNGWWNPLADDRDAFRLAVKLGISVHLDLRNRIVVAKPKEPEVGNEEIHYDESKFGGECDPYAATRRAIAAVAAEIGRLI